MTSSHYAWSTSTSPGDFPVYRVLEAVCKLSRKLRRHGSARDQAAHHYDRPDQLYELFLDRDRQYSCAYFTNPGDGLDSAQDDKKRHLAAKLLLKPGQRIPDIGCGWGELGLGAKLPLHFTSVVMPGLDPGIHVGSRRNRRLRGWPGRARP